MKDPSRSSTSPSIINEDVIINGHSHEDDNPFAEYMWMENEEEFNRQIEEELWEEEFIERCFQEMLEEEEEHEWFIPARDLPQTMDQIRGGGRSARRAGERRCLWRSAEADRIRWLPSPLPCTGLKTTSNANHERSKSQQY